MLQERLCATGPIGACTANTELEVPRFALPLSQDEADKAAAANNLGARYTKSRAYLEWAQESGPIVTTVWGDLPFLSGCADNGAPCPGHPTL